MVQSSYRHDMVAAVPNLNYRPVWRILATVAQSFQEGHFAVLLISIHFAGTLPVVSHIISISKAT